MKRTQRTSDFLKECIADSLLRLLRTKPLEAITIREITELANVSRVTYYRNFTSKEEVIEFKLDKLMTDWIEHEKTIRNTSACELAIRFSSFLLHPGYRSDSDSGETITFASQRTHHTLWRRFYTRLRRILSPDFHLLRTMRSDSYMDGYRYERVSGRNGKNRHGNIFPARTALTYFKNSPIGC